MDTWHEQTLATLENQFETSLKEGLSKEEARTRLQRYGHNHFKKTRNNGPFTLFAKQWRNPLVVVLALAFFATLYLGEHVDALVIAIALLVNVIIGFFQEFRAERAFDALVASQQSETVVVRDGEQTVVKTTDLVPGDVVVCEIGDVIPADARVISQNNFAVSEAHLTGESIAVGKHNEPLPHETPIYEMKNTIFTGSPVLTGDAHALVVATGEHTQIGAIAKSVHETKDEKTPIEKSVDKLARFISILIVFVIVLLFVFGFVREVPVSETLLLAIALAVSVVPEGLPAAVTAVLAIGMERILKKKGLVRNLLAAETLGSTTIILTDKTGTLTTGRMTLKELIVGNDSGLQSGAITDSQQMMLKNALRVSNAFLDVETNDVHGNPIERALVRAAVENEVYEPVMQERENERVDYLAFESSRRFAAGLYKHKKDTQLLYVTGAPELLLEHATHVFKDGGDPVKLTAKKKEEIEKSIDEHTSAGRRLVATGYKVCADPCISRSENAEDTLPGLTFTGLLVFSDPVRRDVADAMNEVQHAGVHVIMVTGDTARTALSVAKEAGIETHDHAVTGTEIEAMNDYELLRALREVRVFARILPHQKRRLVRVLQEEHEVVAMTGDGVNDAPALKAAAIGIAVGSGTEVARGASDLVLLDNSFSIIVAAIREGRRIMDNLKKAVTHLVTTSFHEVFLIGFAVIAGLPLPVLPLQILWVNILEEGFLTFGFAFEPGEKDVMKRNPRSEELKTILTKKIRKLIIIAGTITGVFSIVLFLWLQSRGLPIEEIRTIMFVVLALDAILFAISLKQLHQPLWVGSLFNNGYLLFALSISIAGLALTLWFEPLRTILQLQTPTTFDFAVLFGVALVNLLTIELSKRLVFPPNITPHEISRATF